MNNNREPLHFSPFPLMGFSPYAVGSRSLFENRADRQTLFNRSMSELNKRINFNALEVPILEGLSALFFSLTTRPEAAANCREGTPGVDGDETPRATYSLVSWRCSG